MVNFVMHGIECWPHRSKVFSHGVEAIDDRCIAESHSHIFGVYCGQFVDIKRIVN